MKKLVLAVTLSAQVFSIPLANAREAKSDKQVTKLLSLSPEHFRDNATIKDDSLETVAIIDTSKGFQYKQGLLGIVNSDTFIRAFIDKKSGKTTFQIYTYLTYYGTGWNFFEIVNYETPDGPRSVEATVISRDVGSCTSLLGCSHTETVGFSVPEDLLTTIASRYVANSSLQNAGLWRFRLKGKSGQDVDMNIVPAEVGGLLLAVKKFRGSRGLD